MENPANQVIATARRPARTAPDRVGAAAERLDANIDRILRAAAVVFAEKGFGLATVRDIAAAAGISFPRIYYYLRNKEEILYLISKRAFERLIAVAEAAAAAATPGERLYLFIRGHLEYHMDNLAEMKVLVREADSLSSGYAWQITRLKRDYSKRCRRLIEQVALHQGVPLARERSRLLTALLFGAMNWFYTWYDPARDAANREQVVAETYRMIMAAIGAA